MEIADHNIWKSIILSDPAPICAFDHDLILIAFNQAHADEFKRKNGIKCEIGDRFCDLLPKDEGAALRSLMKRALTGETFEILSSAEDGAAPDPRWAFRFAPVHDARSRVIAAFYRAEDVSAQLSAELDLIQNASVLRKPFTVDVLHQAVRAITAEADPSSP